MERLFSTEKVGGRALYKLQAVTVFAGICLVLCYRATHIPAAGTCRAAWLGMLAAELWFGFYWVITQSVRWHPVRRRTFKDRLAARYGDRLPCVDIFVCTADPHSEPPSLVMATVLSLMAYNYPPEKLNVYLSDDGGSVLTFYALWETSSFAKHWLPFCRRYNIEPRSPAAYFAESEKPNDPRGLEEWSFVKGLYEEMTERIDSAVRSANVPEEIRANHRGFSEWNTGITSKDHQPIVQVLIDGKDRDAVDNEGNVLPTLVYMAREKRPQYHHNFKAGAMNALVELRGFDGVGGPLYIGTGCFHRREILCGRRFTNDYKEEWDRGIKEKIELSINQTEEKAKSLATCIYEHNTQWGNEIGVKYGFPVEDVITGLTIHCRGWKSVCNNPLREAFTGVAPKTLAQTILQHKRWSEGNFSIFLSKYCPFIFGNGNISLQQQMAYSVYGLWAPNSLATLYYVIIPSMGLLKGIPLFPKVMSPWIMPYMYVSVVKNIYSAYEALLYGDTLRGWWNGQRMWMIRRITSYLYGVIDTVRKMLGLSKMAFLVSPKVSDEDELKRYEQEIMEFGTSSPDYVIIATIALLNVVCLVGGLCRIFTSGRNMTLNGFFLQVVLCGLLVIINVPIYEAMFLRKDRGRIPFSVTLTSVGFVMLALSVPLF
ncbi:unnamed protein product [Urochloa decumbens]|uniref:Cellulose synthase-like protein E6 n=1 Tax=Urochloa decumbens TaxID=240449 RepID=A0ABC9FUK9_9POAL